VAALGVVAVGLLALGVLLDPLPQPASAMPIATPTTVNVDFLATTAV
jgi:hypothetical protein